MRLLVIGASGLVGGYLMRSASARGHLAVGTYYQTQLPGLQLLSLEDHERFAALFHEVSPDVVILSAAMVWADGCERQPEKTNRLNHECPVAMGQFALDAGAHVVFISTNYVFDGAQGPYDESSATGPINVYGKTKLLAENALMAHAPDHVTVVRTCGVYGEEVNGKNYLYQVVRNLRTGRPMRVADDQSANATYAGDLAWGIVRLAEERQSGVWNLAGPDPRLSRFDFAVAVARVYGLDEELLLPTPTRDLAQLAARPLEAGLLNAKAEQSFGYSPKDHFLLSPLTPSLQP